MSSNQWHSVPTSGIAARQKNALVGGPFGSDLVSKDYVNAGVPVIRGQNMQDRWVGGEFVFVEESKADALSANLARPLDIVFTQRGTLGQVALVPRKPWSRYLVSQSQMKLTVDSSIADPMFFYYVFTSPEQIVYINQRAIQTGVPHTNLSILRQTPVPLPPLPEQRAIAGVLGALDDKIEVNRKTARVLEGIARAVFTSWFVDFDPVRRRTPPATHGSTPVPPLPPDLAALFPKRLVDSPIGEVPEGWRVGTIGDIATAARDGVDPGEIDAETPYIGLEHMPRRCIALDQWEHAGKVTSGKSRFYRGQILFGKLRPYFHKVGVAPVDGVCSTDIIVSEPKKPCWMALTLGHLSSYALIKHADGSSTGTKMPRTNWRDLAAFEIAIPPEPIAAKATALIAPFVQRMEAGIHANRALATLRDELLPKLISGDLRIADADKIVGRAT